MGGISWFICCLAAALQVSRATDYASDPVVQLFQEYLQINTTTNNDLTPAVDFWKRLAAEENLPISVYEYKEGYPVIVIKWAGTDSTLSSIMLNSHIDVVPADEDDGWTYPPFSAYIDDSGNIYARGTQDMKSVSIQYFEALRRLKANNVQLLRDVYMTLMPDKEVGGENGMIPFVASEEFAALNVGLEMDEGSPFGLSVIAMFYQDKVMWRIQVDCHGEAVHSSLFPDTNSTATGKCNNVINRLFKFRDEQYEIASVETIMNAGSYTSTDLNIMIAGAANNIIPQQVTLIFDIRPAINLSEDQFDEQIRGWLAEAGTDITLTYILKNEQSLATIRDDSNPYWVALLNAIQKLNISIVSLVNPGSTDARFVRNTGIPAFGFSPMPNTPLLVNAVDEHLNAETFLRGVEIYQEFIASFANIPADQVSNERFSYVAKTTA